MALYTNIQAALDTKLATLASGTDIAWENTVYTPVVGTSFIRTIHISAPASRTQVVGLEQRHDGLYLLNIFTEAEKGLSISNTLVDELYTLFTGVDTLTAGGDTLVISGVSREGSSTVEGWYRVQMNINYYIYD